MRVVAGTARGRRLEAPAGQGTRPTADRVREATFNALGSLGVVEGTVLDLFAGSGALGIEALSRGASDAVFVDRDRRAVAVVRRNLAAIGADAQVFQRDVSAFLRRRGEGRYDLVFIDPPYDGAFRLGAPLSELLPAALSENARIVTESPKRSPLELDLPLVRERSYGDTRIAIHHA